MKRESEQVDKPIAMMENQQNFMESLWQSLGGPGQSQQPVVQSQASPNMKGLQQGYPQQRGCNQGIEIFSYHLTDNKNGLFH